MRHGGDEFIIPLILSPTSDKHVILLFACCCTIPTAWRYELGRGPGDGYDEVTKEPSVPSTDLGGNFLFTGKL